LREETKHCRSIAAEAAVASVAILQLAAEAAVASVAIWQLAALAAENLLLNPHHPCTNVMNVS
jgi:hypothetical protein